MFQRRQVIAAPGAPLEPTRCFCVNDHKITPANKNLPPHILDRYTVTLDPKLMGGKATTVGIAVCQNVPQNLRYNTTVKYEQTARYTLTSGVWGDDFLHAIDWWRKMDPKAVGVHSIEVKRVGRDYHLILSHTRVYRPLWNIQLFSWVRRHNSTYSIVPTKVPTKGKIVGTYDSESATTFTHILPKGPPRFGP